MRNSSTLLAAGLALSVSAVADVRELDGEEMVETFVQGISIGQPVVGEKFASDDQAMRDTTTEQKNALGVVEPELKVSNIEVLDKLPVPTADKLIANISNTKTRDLVEDAIMQTSLSTRLDINLDRVATETGIDTGATSRDFSVLRGSVLELLPSATGYQFEFMKDRF